MRRLAAARACLQVPGVGLHNLQPSVHYESTTRSACVFTGHISNLDELADRYCTGDPLEGPTSPSSILAARTDPRQLAAETILRMYMKERGSDPLVLLSELQVGAGGAGRRAHKWDGRAPVPRRRQPVAMQCWLACAATSCHGCCCNGIYAALLRLVAVFVAGLELSACHGPSPA